MLACIRFLYKVQGSKNLFCASRRIFPANPGCHFSGRIFFHLGRNRAPRLKSLGAKKNKLSSRPVSAHTEHVRRVVFYLHGNDPDCTAGDIAQYCADRNIKVSTCRILPSRRFGTSAARLSVAKQDAEREGIMSSNFWPEHIGIRLWAFPDVQPGDEWHPSRSCEAPLQTA